MFERFTERARKVVVLAQDEARRLNHNYVGTEHLLLSLLRDEEGVGARALRALDIHLDEVREQVESIVGYGEEEIGAQVPFTPRSKKVLQLAEREALQLGDNYVRNEHILLGLVRESEGVAARALSNLGVDPDEVRREVVRRIPGSGRGRDPLDEIEREMEEEKAGRKLFRGTVKNIRAELALPRLLTVTVDADYAYRTFIGSEGGSATVEPAEVADLVHSGLRETEARSLEAVITTLGKRLLDTFPAMLEVTITVSGTTEPAYPPAATFSLFATFRR